MRKTILLVDDSPMIRRIVGQILDKSGYNVILAENGQRGFELSREHLPDLIIMDIEMPVMNGIAATTRIKSNTQTAHIPVLIFTSLGSEADINRAKKAGVHGFLNKPICKEELQEAINNILDSTETE